LHAHNQYPCLAKYFFPQLQRNGEIMKKRMRIDENKKLTKKE
jgi:hypothetical protein